MIVGWIGLGEMGIPMAANLVAAGHRVLGYDHDAARLELAMAAGVEPAASLADVAAQADLVVSMLRTVAQTEVVLAGAGGLAVAVAEARGLVVAVMSTLEPRSLQRIAAETASRLVIVDAPVSGGVRGAEAGTLSIMAAGPAQALDLLRPVFDVLGATVVAVGAEPGLGQAAKLANQVMMAVNMAGVLEALAVARSYGVSDEAVRQTAGAGTGNSWVLEHWSWMTSLWEQYTPGNALDILVKDIRAVVAETGERGVDVPLTTLAFERLLGEWELP